MTQQGVLTKAELLEELRSSRQNLLDKLGALPEDQLEQGRYEGGWNARQILAHVASIEWTYTRLIDVARQGAPDQASGGSGKAPEGSQKPTQARPAKGGIGSYNERQVEKRAQASVAELLAEFQKNRDATIEAVEQADDALLQVHIRSAGGIPGPLARVIYFVAVVHVAGHVNDILGS
jgi:uncharacterized protein (TIGR03083 family)